jgi:AraC family transcriptional regulator
MQPKIITIPEKKLIGMHMPMSLVQNKTVDLWRNFMPRRGEIKNKVNTEFISMQVYDPSYDFTNFDPAAQFEKWAAVEVNSFDHVPPEMEKFVLPSGLYAVFQYKGDLSGAANMFRYIFGEWLPNSGYTLDNRPHFEILGEKYKNNDPNSEEDIYIPIK